MLPVEQVIPFVRHADPLVVELALNHLQRIRSPERLTGDFLLEAIQAGHASLRDSLGRFEPTGAVLDYAIEFLERRANELEEDEDEGWAYDVIDGALDALMTPKRISALEQITESRPDEELRERLKLMSWDTEALQKQFLLACDAIATGNTAMAQYGEVWTICNRLIFRGESVDWAVQELAACLGKPDSWREVWLFRLLSESGYRPLFQIAVDQFPLLDPDEDEALLEEVVDALSNLAGPEDMPAFEALWDKASPELKPFLSELLGRQRFAEAEPVLLRFAKAMGPGPDQTFAAIWLCEMLADGEDVREFIRDLTDDEAFDIEMADVEASAIPLGIILGKPFAEEERWRERLENPDPRKAARRTLMAQRYQDVADVSRTFDAFESLDDEEDDEEDGEEFEDDLGPMEPLPRLTSARTVGRNDPCPCGSGKKYKKCCLDKNA